MAWDTAFAENIGGRDEQQDRVCVCESGANVLLCVADGMGGHKGGAVASQILAETAQEHWDKAKHPVKDPRAFLEGIAMDAHSRINTAGEEQGIEPRSTCVLLYGTESSAYWIWIGDSRLYRFRDDGLRERTKDHSVIQMLLEMGKITEDEMATHPDQNRLLQSLGGDKDPEIAYDSVSLSENHGFVLCSDGFWETVTTDEMGEALTSTNLSGEIKSLVAKAAERGGSTGDNIAAAVGRVKASGRTGAGRTITVGILLIIAAAAAAFASFALLPGEEKLWPIDGAKSGASPTAPPPSTGGASAGTSGSGALGSGSSGTGGQ